MIIEEYLIESSNQMLIAGKDTENILAFLRENGCSKIKSFVILKKLYKIPLDEAEDLVHLSKTWQDAYECDAENQRILFEVLTQL